VTSRLGTRKWQTFFYSVACLLWLTFPLVVGLLSVDYVPCFYGWPAVRDLSVLLLDSSVVYSDPVAYGTFFGRIRNYCSRSSSGFETESDVFDIKSNKIFVKLNFKWPSSYLITFKFL
jgi:hypothetical protein